MVAVFLNWSGDDLSAGALATSSAGTGDTAPSAIVGAASPTIVASGARSPRIRVLASPSSDPCGAGWFITAQTQGAVRFYITTPASLPGSGNLPVFARVQSDTTVLLALDFTSTGRMNLRDASTVLQQTPSDTIAPDTNYRVELLVNHSTGAVSARVYAADSGTLVATLSATVGTLGASHNRVYLGKLNSAVVGEYFLDDLAISNTDALIGSAATNSLPSAGAGSDQNVNTGATVTLSGSASDTDGTVVSTVWTQTAGPSVSLSGSGLSRTFVPTTAGIYEFRLTVTDDRGGVSTDDVVVNARGTTATPNALAANPGGWTNEGGAASLVAALADSTDTTFAQTPDNPSAASKTTILAPLQAGVVTITTRDRATVASPVITRTVDILDSGDTVRGTSSFALTTTWTPHTTTSGAFSFAAGAVVKVRISDTQAA